MQVFGVVVIYKTKNEESNVYQSYSLLNKPYIHYDAVTIWEYIFTIIPLCKAIYYAYYVIR